MKIQTSKANRSNLKVQILDGLTLSFNENRVAELEDESRLKELMAADPSISVYTGKKPERVLEGEPDRNPEEKEVEGTGEQMVGEEIKEGEAALLESDSETGEQTEVEQDNVNIATSEDKEEEIEDSVSIEDMKMPDLKELCQESGLPEEEWRGIKKRIDLIAYVQSKLSE